MNAPQYKTPELLPCEKVTVTTKEDLFATTLIDKMSGINTVGRTVGGRLGTCFGPIVGITADGVVVGRCVSTVVGFSVTVVGAIVGSDGVTVGDKLGPTVGAMLGLAVGLLLGCGTVGEPNGAAEGAKVGNFVGITVNTALGVEVGLKDGIKLG